MTKGGDQEGQMDGRARLEKRGRGKNTGSYGQRRQRQGRGDCGQVIDVGVLREMRASVERAGVWINVGLISFLGSTFQLVAG